MTLKVKTKSIKVIFVHKKVNYDISSRITYIKKFNFKLEGLPCDTTNNSLCKKIIWRKLAEQQNHSSI